MKTEMKNMSALLILALLCYTQLVSSAPLGADTGSRCCMKLHKQRIPLAKVVSYYRTSSSCPKAAIVFKTIAGREFCVDPSDAWVGSHAAHVDSRSTTVTPTSLPIKA